MDVKGHRYTVELRLYGRTLNPDAVSRETGLQPSQARLAGSQVHNKTYNDAMWAFNGGHAGDWDSLEEGLSFVLDQLGTVATFSKYRAEYKMLWWCGHFQSSFDGGPTLSGNLLERLGKLGAEIFIDNYFSTGRQDE